MAQSAAGTAAPDYAEQIKQLRALGIEVVLRGMWIATLPDRHRTRLTRWRLPSLLADINAAIAADSHGIS